MRRALAAVVVLFSGFSFSQSSIGKPAPPSQTARQALIEMFFGGTPDHFEKHLPDATRHSLGKLSPLGGDNYLTEFSTIASQIRSSGAKFETFDAGLTLASAEDPRTGTGPDKIEITVERDDLIGDEDQIELAVHLSKNGKEQNLPVIPRFTFSMQSEADVWRLKEINVTVRIPLEDPNFLKTIEDDQRSRNETRAMWSIQQVNMSEKEFSKSQGHFACSLKVLGKQIGEGEHAVTYLYNPQLAQGKDNGYVFAIAGCDAKHYQIAGEPALSDTGQRAFCSDDGGDIRASADGKATTCLATGEVVQRAIASPTGGGGQDSGTVVLPTPDGQSQP